MSTPIKSCPFCREALKDTRDFCAGPWHNTTITDTYGCSTQSEREAYTGEDTAKFKQSDPCKIIAKLKEEQVGHAPGLKKR